MRLFYFWTLHRPDLLPPVGLFVLGVVLDAVGGMPVGVTALPLLLVRAAPRRGQRWLRGQASPVAWACFLPAAMIVAGLRWGLGSSLLAGRLLPVLPVAARGCS